MDAQFSRSPSVRGVSILLRSESPISDDPQGCVQNTGTPASTASTAELLELVTSPPAPARSSERSVLTDAFGIPRDPRISNGFASFQDILRRRISSRSVKDLNRSTV